MFGLLAIVVACLLLFAAAGLPQTASGGSPVFSAISQASSVTSNVSFVTSKDGTRIAVECAGTGPRLLIVHGGTGDRRRWQPLLPLFATRFNVCAMDRRGHGDSESGANYSLEREFEDVAAVADSQPGPVFVLGHSLGGVCALEAAFLSNKISRLVLYEPPLQDKDHSAVAGRMEQMIRSGGREEALLTFLREVVQISPAEIDRMRVRPTWPDRVATVDIQIREMRSLSKYRFDAGRVKKLNVPTLLLTCGKTASTAQKPANQYLINRLSNRTLIVFEDQEHNAMDTIPEQFAAAVTKYLEGRARRIRRKD